MQTESIINEALLVCMCSETINIKDTIYNIQSVIAFINELFNYHSI